MIQQIKSFILGVLLGGISVFLFMRYSGSEIFKQIEEKDKEIKEEIIKIEEEIKSVDKDIKKIDDKLKNIPEDEQWHLKR